MRHDERAMQLGATAGAATDAAASRAPAPSTHAVEVDSATIRYRLWNCADSSAPGLLFVHGYRAHSHWWDHIVPHFTADYRVAAMDLSGLGDSDWRDVYSAPTFARELLAVSEDAALNPVTIVAHSFGGTPAAIASALAPEKVRRAIIIDSRMLIAGLPEPDPRELQALKFENRVYPSREDMIRRFRLLPPSDAVAPELFDYIARHSVREVEGGWAWKFDARLDPQLTQDPDRLVPPGVQTPIDYMYGERSDVVTPEFARIITGSFANASAPFAIPGANHHVLLEEPVALIAAIRALLSRDAD